MKVASALFFLAPLLLGASAQGNNGNQRNQGNNGGNQGNNGGNQGNNGGNQGNNGGNQGNNGGNQGNNGGGNPQTSLTLDPRVVAAGFAQNGQNPPTEGQVPSLTSTNNFINFCLTVPNLPITDGKQIQTGSCNPNPIGVIPNIDNMPSGKISNPKNGATIAPNTPFNIEVTVRNFATGQFTNAQANYFAAPQQLNGAGQILGHSHVVMELLTSLDQVTPTDPKKFAFFKGLNNAAVGGKLSTEVTNGVPAGAYRICTINSSSNHQPVIVPVAQHGSLDDCIYVTAGAAQGGNAGQGGQQGGNAGQGGQQGGNAGQGGQQGGNAGQGGQQGGNAGQGGQQGGNAGQGGQQGGNAGQGGQQGGNAGQAGQQGGNAGQGGQQGGNAGQGGQQGGNGGQGGQQGGQQGGGFNGGFGARNGGFGRGGFNRPRRLSARH